MFPNNNKRGEQKLGVITVFAILGEGADTPKAGGGWNMLKPPSLAEGLY